MATKQWTGQSAAFTISADWTPAGPPGAGDTASLAGSLAYTVSQSGLTSVGALVLNDPLATLTVGGTLVAPGGVTIATGTMLAAGTLDNLSIGLGGSGPAVLEGAFLSNLSFYPYGYVYEPVFGANTVIQTNGTAAIGFSANYGNIIALTGTLSLTGAPNDGTHQTAIGRNAGTVETAGALLIANAYTDYRPGDAVPVGQVVIANRGIFEVSDAFTRLGAGAVTHANVSFADATGSIAIATNPNSLFLDPATLAVANFQAGNSITSLYGGASSFNPGSNTLTFYDAGSGVVHATITFGSAHGFAAGDLLGLGTATVTTSYVIPAGITNVIPTPRPNTAQWLGQSASFADPNQWTPLGTPGTGQTASLAGTTAYIARQAGSISLGALIVDAALGTLALGGWLQATGGVSLQAGVLDLTGTLASSTITQTGGTLLAASNGTLDGVRWLGGLQVGGSLTVRNGLTLLAADGAGAGSLQVSGTVALADSETLDHAGIALLGTTALVSGAGALAIGSQAGLSGGGMVAIVGSFSSFGTLTVATGQHLLVTASRIANAGGMLVQGGTLSLTAASFSNSGSIAVTGGEIDLYGGSFALGGLGTLHLDASSTLGLSGGVDLGGGLVGAGVGALLHNAAFNGATLANGTLLATSGNFSGSGLTLVNVDWRDRLVVAAGQTLTADSSDRFDDASGTLPGTIDLTAAGAMLQDSGTLDRVQIDLGGAIVGRGSLDPGGRLVVVGPVLGAGVLVIANGNASLGNATLAMAQNLGVVIAQAGTLLLSGTNLGTVGAVGGLLIARGYSDYLAASVVPTGQSVIANSGTFELAGTSAVAANVRFADNTGSLLLATDPLQAPTQVAAAGFKNGNTIAAQGASGSSFEASSNSIIFLYADGSSARVSLSGNHTFMASELVGLGSASITTSFVAQPIINNFPAGTNAMPQWLGQSGAFGDAANWSPTGVPGASATASLAGTVAYSANQTGSTTLGGLILNANLGTLGVAGSLTATGGFALQSGSLYLAGTLRNTRVTQSGGTLLAASIGTLDNVGWNGRLAVAGSLTVRNGLGLFAADGVAAGSLAVTGSLTFADSETLDHAAIALGGALVSRLGVAFGANASVQVAGSASLIGAFTNAGQIAAGAGQTLAVAGAFSNSGTLLANGGTIAFAAGPTNSGLITARNGGEIDLGNVSLSGLVAAGVRLDATSTLAVTGTLDLGGTTVDFGPTSPLYHVAFRNAVLANGQVNSAAGTFTGTLAGLNNVDWRGPLNLAAGTSLRLDSASRLHDASGLQAGTIALAAGGTLTDPGLLDNVQVFLGDRSSAAPALLGGLSGAFTPSLTLGANASVVSNGNASLAIASNLGSIVALSGTLVLADTGAAGAILVNGAVLDVTSFATGTANGTVTIAGGGVLALTNGVADTSGHSGAVASTHANVNFADATGTLDIVASSFQPPMTVLNVPALIALSGFQLGDSIVANLGTASFQAASETLTFYDAAAAVTTAIITLGNAYAYTAADFQGLGSSTVTTSHVAAGVAACFATGTRIATARGDIPVEALDVGDQVITADGGTAPIVWIGQRTVDCTATPRPHDVMPVCVAAGAFGDLPVRDLLLSPDHGLFVDGALIPVRYLLNGATIFQQPVLRVTYWHIELPRHAILLAERLAAESYLDTGNRHAFSNGGPVVQLQPDFARAVWAREGCAPLVTEGAALLAVRQRLDATARARGFIATAEPDLHLLVDGVRIDPVRIGDSWQFNLVSSGHSRVHLRSRRARPADTDPASTDCRILGVAVRALRFNDAALLLDGPALGAGWLPAEAGWRWTDGVGELHLAGLGVLEVEIALVPPGWQTPAGSSTQRQKRA